MEYNEVPVTFIKTECDDEDAIDIKTTAGTTPTATDFGLPFKQENDFVVKTEDESCEVEVKQEPDIGPTLLQPMTAPCMLLPLNQAVTDPYPSTSSRPDMLPPSLCTIPVQPVPQVKVKDNYSREDSEVPSDGDLLLIMRRNDDTYHSLSGKRFRELSDVDDASINTRERSSCKYCDKSPTESGTDEADSRIVGKQYGCKHCSRKKSDATKSMSTSKKSHKKRRYNTSQLKLVKKHVHPCRSRKSFKCEHCDYNAHRMCNLKIHMRIHTGEKPYKCDRCEYSATQPGHLKTHSRSHMVDKPFKCERCEYSASQLRLLKLHILTHTGEKPFKCELCEYGASELSRLKRHLRTHTGEKPFNCELCEYSASEAGQLKSHMRTHTGEKPYKCMYCEYSVSRQRDLKRHIRAHTGEKPFKCELCEYSASEKSNLISHIRTHTGEKPYKCGLCEYGAARYRSVKLHMLARHASTASPAQDQ